MDVRVVLQIATLELVWALGVCEGAFVGVWNNLVLDIPMKGWLPVSRN